MAVAIVHTNLGETAYMKLSVRSFHGSADVYDSLKQATGHLDTALSEEGVNVASIEGISKIIFTPQTWHPALRERKLRGVEFDRKTQTYFLPSEVRYAAWAVGDWAQRVGLLAAACVAGIARLPKTRASEAQRNELRSAVSRAADVARAAPPDTLAPLKPIFVRTDSEGKASGVNFNGEDGMLAGSGFLIAPEDAGKYEDVQLWPPRSLAQPFKLYRRDGDSGLRYHEAWFDQVAAVVEHWGECGDRGGTREHPVASEKEAERLLARLKKATRADGYRPIALSRMPFLIIEYDVEGWGSPEDLERRHKIETQLNELIGWMGLGHVDGGSIGSGTMEVAVRVVDFAIAKGAIEKATKGTDMAGFSRIYRQR